MEEKVSVVRFHNDAVTVEWTDPNGNDREEHRLHSNDAPRSSFVEAFEALNPYALKLLHVEDATVWAEVARVSKLTIKRDDSGRRKVTMAVVVPLDHGSTTCNTPLRSEVLDEDEVVGEGTLSDDLLGAILTVCSEAMAYVRGQREQGDLFAGVEDEEEAPVAA